MSSVAEVRECARGCLVAVGIGEEVSDLPAVAEAGTVLCTKCLARLRWRLGDLSDIAARARLALVPGQAASTDGEKVSGSRQESLPFNVVALETCDALVNLLGEWCLEWSRLLLVDPPPLLAGALGGDRELRGVKAGTDADAVAVALEEWVWWVRVQWDALAAHSRVSDFHDAVVKGVERAARRFPRDEERVVEQRPRYCPICEIRQVRVSWPMRGADPIVACSSCGWVFETEWREFLEQIGI